jgi:flagella basal body P-ring formation protein FlgA
MMQKHRFASFFLLLAIAVWQPSRTLAGAPATGWQDHAAIRAAAQGFLEAFVGDHQQGRSEVRLGQLDHRLKLKACRAPLEAFMPPGGRVMGNTTVGVRCPGQDSWSIYVSARIDVFGPVLVARQPLARGARVEENDLELVERNLANLPYGYYSDGQAVAGMLTKRTIAAATVITPPMLQEPKLVKRGERVSVIAESGPLKIRSSGKALSDGGSGDLIRVRADRSGRTIDAVVVSEGVVKVTL